MGFFYGARDFSTDRGIFLRSERFFRRNESFFYGVWDFSTVCEIFSHIEGFFHGVRDFDEEKKRKRERGTGILRLCENSDFSGISRSDKNV